MAEKYQDNEVYLLVSQSDVLNGYVSIHQAKVVGTPYRHLHMVRQAAETLSADNPAGQYVTLVWTLGSGIRLEGVYADGRRDATRSYYRRGNEALYGPAIAAAVAVYLDTEMRALCDVPAGADTPADDVGPDLVPQYTGPNLA
jgi:hypothetical protein